MEDLMDVDMKPLRPQNYLFGYELKADKDDHFKVDNDENEHKLSLRTVSLGAGEKIELHIVEAEAMKHEGSPIKVTLATLKVSVQPTVSLGGFEIMPPVVLQVKCGSGPVHVSGQHLVAVEENAESEDEEEKDVRLLSLSGKRSAPGSGSKFPKKKVKLYDEDHGNHDEGEDDNEEDGDEFDDEEMEEKAPVKKSIRETPAKNAQKSNQNGKDLKSSTPKSKGQESLKKQEKPPKIPKGPSSIEDIKAKMQVSIEKHGFSSQSGCQIHQLHEELLPDD